MDSFILSLSQGYHLVILFRIITDLVKIKHTHDKKLLLWKASLFAYEEQ